MAVLYGNHYSFSLIVISLMIIAAGITQAFEEFEEVDERIYNGFEASKGQFPYIAKIYNTKSTGKRTGCTGSIISNQWILAAAHCLIDVDSAQVVLGLYKLPPVNSSKDILVYSIPKSNLYQHPDYDGETKVNDLALYKLPVPAPVNQKEYPDIKTIALSKSSDKSVNRFENQNATAAGWGAYNDTTPVTNVLRFAPVHIMNHEECVKQVEDDIEITEDMICTDSTVFPHGICQGDSGGPLIVKKSDGSPMVIGAASFMVGICSNKKPRVYSSVAQNLKWIAKTTGINMN